jgi:DNA-binding transcriptional regulator YhcF (GntR family)
MQRALQQLEREGLVYTQRSSGRFVTEDLTTIARTRDALAAAHVARFREAMEGLGYSEQEMIGLLKGRKEEEDGKLS